MAHRPSSDRAARRGNAAVTIGALVPLLGFVALVVDIGILQTAHTELQLSTDASALAATALLDRTSEGITAARTEAIYVASLNRVMGQPLSIQSDDLLFGRFDSETKRFVSETDPKKIDAVRVQSDVQKLDTFFAAAAFGKKFTETRATSIAATTANSGPGSARCYLPVAIPDCYLADTTRQQYVLRMASAGVDNAGWAEVGGSPSAATVVEQLSDGCSSGTAYVGDTVGLNNGQITSAMHQVDDLIESSSAWWDPAQLGAIPAAMPGSTVFKPAYGKIFEGPIIIFTPPSGTVCGSSTQFNQSAPISGFAWGVVYDVDSSGTDKDIRILLDLSYVNDGGTGSGGIASNLTFPTYELVQ
jgi:Flp pilus assembly protein TadG